MARKRKCGGVGADCSAKYKFFHPSAPIRENMGEAALNRECFNGVLSLDNVIMFLVVSLALNVMSMNVLILTSLASPSKLPNIMYVLNKKG